MDFLIEILQTKLKMYLSCENFTPAKFSLSAVCVWRGGGVKAAHILYIIHAMQQILSHSKLLPDLCLSSLLFSPPIRFLFESASSK